MERWCERLSVVGRGGRGRAPSTRNTSEANTIPCIARTSKCVNTAGLKRPHFQRVVSAARTHEDSTATAGPTTAGPTTAATSTASPHSTIAPSSPATASVGPNTYAGDLLLVVLHLADTLP